MNEDNSSNDLRIYLKNKINDRKKDLEYWDHRARQSASLFIQSSQLEAKKFRYFAEIQRELVERYQKELDNL